jgi:hypothetical protein
VLSDGVCWYPAHLLVSSPEKEKKLSDGRGLAPALEAERFAPVAIGLQVFNKSENTGCWASIPM